MLTFLLIITKMAVYFLTGILITHSIVQYFKEKSDADD